LIIEISAEERHHRAMRLGLRHDVEPPGEARAIAGDRHEQRLAREHLTELEGGGRCRRLGHELSTDDMIDDPVVALRERAEYEQRTRPPPDAELDVVAATRIEDRRQDRTEPLEVGVGHLDGRHAVAGHASHGTHERLARGLARLECERLARLTVFGHGLGQDLRHGATRDLSPFLQASVARHHRIAEAPDERLDQLLRSARHHRHPQPRQARSQHGHTHRPWLAPRDDLADLLHHPAIGHDVRPTDIKGLAPGLAMQEHIADERDDIIECDGLSVDLGPARAHHDWQPPREVEDDT